MSDQYKNPLALILRHLTYFAGKGNASFFCAGDNTWHGENAPILRLVPL
jgi:hypothetical protein